jgi:hypothetical protein
MTESEIKEYKAFMYNKKNIRKCDSCPENRQMKGLNQLPCGQYRCWVSCHCKKK